MAAHLQRVTWPRKEMPVLADERASKGGRNSHNEGTAGRSTFHCYHELEHFRFTRSCPAFREAPERKCCSRTPICTITLLHSSTIFAASTAISRWCATRETGGA